MTLLKQIARQAALQGEKCAYRSRGGALTYTQLWEKAAALAGFLAGQDSPVLVCGGKEPLMPVCFLACLLAGRPFVPCEADAPPERLAYIREASAAGTILAAAPAPPALAGPCLAEAPEIERLCAQTPPIRELPANPGRDAYILFTSGSTGRPKGVRIPVSALEHFTRWFSGLPGCRDCVEDTTINQARFSFDLSVADLWPAWAAGGTVFALDSTQQADLALLYAALGESGGARLTATPSFLRLCLCDAAFCQELLPRLRCVFLCGETLPARTARQFRERFPGARLLNAYGPTEATCAVCTAEITGEMEPLPVGEVATAASELLILGPEGEPLPEGEPGEIAIAGPSVGRGYIGAAGGGFGCWRGRALYRTGDRGKIAAGRLWYLGRIDRQIKYKGYRIEPGEVEGVLSTWPEVHAAAVLPLRRRGEVLGLAAVVEWAAGPLPPEECARRMRASLPSYMCPRVWQSVSPMPLTSNGKQDLKKLEELLQHE